LPSITEWTPAQRAAKVSEEMLSNYDDGTVTRVGPVENDKVSPTPSYSRKQVKQTTAVTLGCKALRMDGKSSRLFTNIMANKISTFPHRRKSKPALPPRSQHSAKIHPSYADKPPPVRRIDNVG